MRVRERGEKQKSPSVCIRDFLYTRVRMQYIVMKSSKYSFRCVFQLCQLFRVTHSRTYSVIFICFECQAAGEISRNYRLVCII